MLVIKTSLKEFKGKGIGLVAEQNIKKGEAVWVYNPVIDITVKEKDIPNEAKEFFRNYGVNRWNGTFFLCTDNARFINHSKNPNLKSNGEEEDNVAIRDIKKGEEITIDYEEIEGPINFKNREEKK